MNPPAHALHAIKLHGINISKSEIITKWSFFPGTVTYIWRHGSASILGMTRTVTRARILMYWAGLSRIASPWERRSK